MPQNIIVSVFSMDALYHPKLSTLDIPCRLDGQLNHKASVACPSQNGNKVHVSHEVPEQ